MKNLKKTFFIYFVMISFTVIMYSCCDENYRIVGNGSIAIYDLTTSGYFDNDSVGIVTGRFTIEMNPELEMAAVHMKSGLISSAFATSCDETIENEVVASTLKITCDKAIIYEGDSVAPGTNLTSLEELGFSASVAYVMIDFPDALMEKLEFADKVYQFTVSINTTDDMVLQNSISTRFE